jgi:DNA-binding GntR family transcriptional regulator
VSLEPVMNVYTSKTDLAAAMLRELIVTGELSPGTPLRQRDLASRFGMSPTPVREALRRLESEGLVAGDVHRGVTVVEPSQGPVADNYRIRAALEPLAAEFAASRISMEALDALAPLNDEMRRVPDSDPETYLDLNERFHYGIYQECGSPVLASLIRSLWQSMPRDPRPIRAHGASADEHDAILAAVRQGDGAQAAALTRDHILAAVPPGGRGRTPTAGRPVAISETRSFAAREQ